MATTFEYSEDFDAVEFHRARMERDDYDPYYDEDEA